MKKQLHKIKLAAENFSRTTKPDKNSEEILAADKQVESYKEVLEKISKKFTQNTSLLGGSSSSGTDVQDSSAREKRLKKVHEYRLAQAIEESLKDLPNSLLHDVLDNCAKLERNIASEIIDNEINVEMDVTKRLGSIVETNISTIFKQKRIVSKLMQDNESAKQKYQAALRVNESSTKINQLREEQEECETRLEKERDIWAAEMFELIAEEENMSNYIVNYMKHQQTYYRSTLQQIDDVMDRVSELIKGNNKRIYKIPLEKHLAVTERKISYVIELCVSYLLEKGLNEEGLLRVGCAGTKLRRLRSAIDANIIQPPFPVEYQDNHVIAGILKSYLRDLPDPLLTYKLYDEFCFAAQRPTEDKRKKAILNAVNQLPVGNYLNLRYLTKFLSLLAQNHQYNKMSSQNIAIVMSPNLLWAPDSIETDYVAKVNSTAAVNTIVELLVSDWSFFFDGDIDFYQTWSKEELFPENVKISQTNESRDSSIDQQYLQSSSSLSSSSSKQQNVMSKSMIAGSVGSVSGGPTNVIDVSTASYPPKIHYQHSRSSSHDTSLILLNSNDQSAQLKGSPSSSSISDTSSPPQQSSPKLPVRRKHNKQAAPTPPDTKFQHGAESDSDRSRNIIQSTSSFTEHHLHKINNYQQQQQHQHQHQQHSQQSDSSMTGEMVAIQPQQQQQQHNHFEKPQKPPLAKRRFFDSNDNLSSTSSTAAKPDKPPRPVLVSTECQTLNRAHYRSAKEIKSANKAESPQHSMLFVNRSTENLTDTHKQQQSIEEHFYDEVPVTIRNKTGSYSAGDGMEKPSKPAVPERPVTLMRPSSFKNCSPASDNSLINYPIAQSQPNSDSSLKKTQSFRGEKGGNGGNITDSKNQITSTAAVSGNGGNGGGGGVKTTLERTHIYNVDKKQVAIIDFIDHQTNNKTQSQQQQHQQQQSVLAELSEAISDISLTPLTPTASSSSHKQLSAVPPSPRGFDPKIKRPQIPAPPPPTNRPKSDGTSTAAAISGSADSTNL